MAETINVTIRLDKEVKENAERLFNDLGMNLSTAINLFARQSLRQGKIPFEIYDPFYSEKNQARLAFHRRRRSRQSHGPRIDRGGLMMQSRACKINCAFAHPFTQVRFNFVRKKDRQLEAVSVPNYEFYRLFCFLTTKIFFLYFIIIKSIKRMMNLIILPIFQPTGWINSSCVVIPHIPVIHAQFDFRGMMQNLTIQR